MNGSSPWSNKCSRPKSNWPPRRADQDKDFYGNKCATLDRQIDVLVYKLYGLTPDEIKIVESHDNPRPTL